MDRYVSWHPDPGAFAIDAFSLDWSVFKLFYAFHPFSCVGPTIEGSRHPASTPLANETVVGTSGGTGTAKKTLQATKEQSQTYRKTGQCTHVKQKPIGGLPFFAKLLMNQGFEKTTVLLIMDAWRPSTKKLYTTYLNKWALCCVENKVKLLDPTLP